MVNKYNDGPPFFRTHGNAGLLRGSGPGFGGEAAGCTWPQVKGAEKVMYGLDDVAGQEEIIIVEGEMDKLALLEAGIANVLSVPDGAPQRVRPGDLPPPDQDVKYSYLWNCRGACSRWPPACSQPSDECAQTLLKPIYDLQIPSTGQPAETFANVSRTF